MYLTVNGSSCMFEFFQTDDATCALISSVIDIMCIEILDMYILDNRIVCLKYPLGGVRYCIIMCLYLNYIVLRKIFAMTIYI